MRLPCPSGARAQAETIGLLLVQAEDAADRLIDQGFDRLDQSTVGAGYEFRNTVTKIQKAISEETLNVSTMADSQRDKLASELRALIRVAEGSSSTVVADVRAATGIVLDSVTVLLSDGIGSLRIALPIARHAADTIRIELSGAALSQLVIKDLLLDGAATEFDIPRQDDGAATLVVAMPKALPERDGTHPAEVAIAFVVEKPRPFLGGLLRDPFQRRFSTTAVILPKHVGSVAAVYSGAEEVITQQARTERRETPKVQTKTRLVGGILPIPEFVRGTWAGSFSIQASGQSTILRDSIEIQISGNSGCHTSSTAASLGAVNDKEFTISVRIGTDRKAGATCQATIRANYSERMVGTRTVERRDLRDAVVFGDRTVFRTADATDGLTEARIAYFEIASPLFDGGMKRLLPEETVPWAKVETDPAAGYSYVSVSLQ